MSTDPAINTQRGHGRQPRPRAANAWGRHCFQMRGQRRRLSRARWRRRAHGRSLPARCHRALLPCGPVGQRRRDTARYSRRQARTCRLPPDLPGRDRRFPPATEPRVRKSLVGRFTISRSSSPLLQSQDSREHPRSKVNLARTSPLSTAHSLHHKFQVALRLEGINGGKLYPAALDISDGVAAGLDRRNSSWKLCHHTQVTPVCSALVGYRMRYSVLSPISTGSFVSTTSNSKPGYPCQTVGAEVVALICSVQCRTHSVLN